MMKTNLNAWIILAGGVSAPSAATNGINIEADNTRNRVGMMMKSPSSRHRRPNLRHDKYAHMNTKSNKLHHLHTTVLGSNVEQTRRHLEEVLPLDFVANGPDSALGNW